MTEFRDIFPAHCEEAAVTENGAPTFNTSGSACVDFFGNVCRSGNKLTSEVEDKVLSLLPKMWNENPLHCLKLIFHKRDCRGGAGEKAIFQVCYNWLVENHYTTAYYNVHHVPFYGSWKDLVNLWCAVDGENTDIKCQILDLFVKQLLSDQKSAGSDEESKQSISLAAKWAPSVGVNNPRQKELAKGISFCIFGDIFMWEKPYRKLLSKLREYLKVTERYMCANEWDEIEFSKVPSLCMQKNKKHFEKHVPDKFAEWLSRVKSGEAKVNAAQLMPHQLIEELERNFFEEEVDTNLDLVQEQWNVIVSQTRNTLGKGKSFLVVTDLSGSMEGLPMLVSKAMGCLLSEVSSPPFNDLVITFSETPTFFNLEGKSLKDRLESLNRSDSQGYNTDLIKVFEILLEKCKRENVESDKLPEMIIICTDNEFDLQIQGDKSETTYRHIKNMFNEAGYIIPTVVFWNLRGNANSIPVTKDELGTVLLSGFSPSILKCLLGGEIPSPYTAMLAALNDERYDRLKVYN